MDRITKILIECSNIKNLFKFSWNKLLYGFYRSVLSLFFDLFPCFHASHSPLCLHRDERIFLKINLKTISNKIQTDSKTP